MIDIEIDGKKISVKEGSMIIEAADQADIYIPRFCYHKKLSVAANCRMCLVEVEKSGKPLPACATPVMPDMKVKTRSKMALAAQEAVMEYLLINHPLDCPICDQGGECELQDLTMGYARDHSHYKQSKRAVADENLGPLIETCMTRCIQCTRCVRFGEEVAGMRELGILNRTQEERIGTYVKHLMQSELSGNIIDLCPVGALLSKPFRYTARAWELRETAMIAPHDCVGANIYVHSRGQEYTKERVIMRVVPRENTAINQTWISDRDRFSYLGLSHPDRILAPKIKREGVWQVVSWQQALAEITNRLQDLLVEEGGEHIAGLISPNATLEECYLFQKWLRMLGVIHIDHRLRQQDFSDQDEWPLYPGLNMPISALSNLKTVLLVGADLRNGQPLLSQRIFESYKKGAVVMTIAPYDFPYPFELSQKIIAADLATTLEQIAMVMVRRQTEPTFSLHPSGQDDSVNRMATDLLARHGSIQIIVGDDALNHPRSAQIRRWLKVIAEHSAAKISGLTEGANSAGAWLAGAVPHRGVGGGEIVQQGKPARTVLTTEPKRAYILAGVEPEYECSYSAAALLAIKQAEFVLCINTFVSQHMLDYADIILPMAAFTETSGTFVNVSGDWQSFEPATLPSASSQPGWKVFCKLAQQFNFPGFDFQEAEAVTHEIKNAVNTAAPINLFTADKKTTSLTQQDLNSQQPHESESQSAQPLIRYAPWPIYRVDGLCRRAAELQMMTELQNRAEIVIHPSLADRLQLNASDQVYAVQGQQKISLPIRISELIAPDAVLLPSALEETQAFGEAFATISLEKGELL